MSSLSTKMSPGSYHTPHASHSVITNSDPPAMGYLYNRIVNNAPNVFRLNTMNPVIDEEEKQDNSVNEIDRCLYDSFCSGQVIEYECDIWKPCHPPMIITQSCSTDTLNGLQYNEIVNAYHSHSDEHDHDEDHDHYITSDFFENHHLINVSDNDLNHKFDEYKKNNIISIEQKKTNILDEIHNHIENTNTLVKQNGISDFETVKDLLDKSEHFVNDFKNISDQINNLSEQSKYFNDLMDILKASDTFVDTETIIKEIEDKFNLKEIDLNNKITDYENELSVNQEKILTLEDRLNILTKNILELENNNHVLDTKKHELLDKIDSLEESIKNLKQLDTENILIIKNFENKIKEQSELNEKEKQDLVNHYLNEMSIVKSDNIKKIADEKKAFENVLLEKEKKYKNEKNGIIEEYEKKILDTKNTIEKDKENIIFDYEKKISNIKQDLDSKTNENEILKEDLALEANENEILKEDLNKKEEDFIKQLEQKTNLISEKDRIIKEKDKQLEESSSRLIEEYKKKIQENKATYESEKQNLIDYYETKLREKESEKNEEIDKITKQYESNTPTNASFLTFRIYNENVLDPLVVEALKEHIKFIKEFLGDIITSSNRNFNILLVIRKLNGNELGAADWLNSMILLNEQYLYANNIPNGWDSLLLNNKTCDIMRQTLLHEVLHILGIGIGTIWNNLVKNSPQNTRLVYTGAEGVNQYNNFFSHFNKNYEFIPLEDDFGPGTKDSHLEEGDVYGGNSEKIVDGQIYPYLSNEIMTGFLNFSNLFTCITAGILKDLNYGINFDSEHIIKSTTSEAYLMSVSENKLINAKLF